LFIIPESKLIPILFTGHTNVHCDGNLQQRCEEWRDFPHCESSAVHSSTRCHPQTTRAHTLNRWAKVKEQWKHVRCNVSEDDSGLRSRPYRRTSTPTLPSMAKQKPPLVTPRHDADLYSGFYGSSCPCQSQGEAPVEKGSAEKGSYDTFCSTMLNHTVGAVDETRSVLAGRSIERYRQTPSSSFFPAR